MNMATRTDILQQVRVSRPTLDDGGEMWRVAKNSQVLDVNPSYAYLLWCRDFAETSSVARLGDDVVGFVSGYLRPSTPETVVVWQIAVDEQARGRGVAGALLDSLVERLDGRGVNRLETTITADNLASQRMFAALARRLGCTLDRSPLFVDDLFPDQHDAEDLYRIGPWQTPPTNGAK